MGVEAHIPRSQSLFGPYLARRAHLARWLHPKMGVEARIPRSQALFEPCSARRAHLARWLHPIMGVEAHIPRSQVPLGPLELGSEPKPVCPAKPGTSRVAARKVNPGDQSSDTIGAQRQNRSSRFFLFFAGQRSALPGARPLGGSARWRGSHPGVARTEGPCREVEDVASVPVAVVPFHIVNSGSSCQFLGTALSFFEA